jgi:hypothetical protein
MRATVIFVTLCLLAMAPPSGAQSADESALKAAALSDLSNFFQHAERSNILPGVVPEVSLYGPIETQTGHGHPPISLCSMPVLSFDYYAPEEEIRAPSQIAPGRGISNIDTKTVYRVIDQGTCASPVPSWSWFTLRDPDYVGGEGMLQAAELARGIIEALKSHAQYFYELDLGAFAHSAPAGSIAALRGEGLQRIGNMSLTGCPPDDREFCRVAEIQFGLNGPLTHLQLTIRESRPSGGHTRIQSAAVWTDWSHIP